MSLRDAGAQPTLVYIGLGANLGEREAALRKALAALGQYPGTRVLRALRGMRRFRKRARSLPPKAAPPKNAAAVAANPAAPQAAALLPPTREHARKPAPRIAGGHTSPRSARLGRPGRQPG